MNNPWERDCTSHCPCSNVDDDDGDDDELRPSPQTAYPLKASNGVFSDL